MQSDVEKYQLAGFSLLVTKCGVIGDLEVCIQNAHMYSREALGLPIGKEIDLQAAQSCWLTLRC